jgi:hypothetical protein
MHAGSPQRNGDEAQKSRDGINLAGAKWILGENPGRTNRASGIERFLSPPAQRSLGIFSHSYDIAMDETVPDSILSMKIF